MDVADRQMGTGNIKQSTGNTTTVTRGRRGRSGSGRRHRAVRRTVLVGALGLTVVPPALVGGTPASAQSSATVATLHGAPNYLGGQRPLSNGEMVDFTGNTWDDAASSIRVPAGQTIAVYEHTKFQGKCETFTASDTDLRNNCIGNDSISSAKFNAACP